MDWKWQIIAGLAMIMIEASYIPQIYRLHKTKKAKDFSIFFPLMNAGGRSLGLLYTGLNGDIVLAVGFLTGIVLRITLLFQVWLYKYRESPVEESSVLSSRFEQVRPHENVRKRPVEESVRAMSWLPMWARLRSRYDGTESRTSPTMVHAYKRTPLLPPPHGSALLLQPVLCHADSCQPDRCSSTYPK